MGIEIRPPKIAAEWEVYYDLRYRILRKPLNQPLGSEKNEGDATGIHFALYDNGELKAIARLDQSDENCMQVRFVAVEENQQGKGFGKLIMLATEQKAIELGANKMILHARENALPFYLNLGYKMIEKSHNLFGLVQHYLMEKGLNC